MNKRHISYLLPLIFLPIVAVAGWFATDHLGNKARQAIIAESRASLLSVSTHVSSTLTNIERAVQALAGSPWIAPALVSGRDRDIEHANNVLDRYNSALNASVSYLMDAGGTTVASSNRKDPDSFVGKSYLFRPYFQEAARGLAGRYFALGATSGKRGFYASHPVKDPSGKVLGVVAMKKDLEEIEGFFKRYPFCFLINPDGIIFLSSSPAMVMKSLYPLDKAVQEQLTASRQFGNKPFEAVFLKMDFAHGTEVTLEGKDYFVSREVIDSEGWSIVLLTPIDHIRIYKLTGILATTSVCLLIMIFSGIIYFTGRTKEAILESEERYRMAIEHSNDGVALVQGGDHIYVNQKFLDIFGYEKPEDIIGKSPFITVHPDDRQMVMERNLKRHRGEPVSSRYEFKGIRRDGATLFIEVSVANITYNGEPVSLAYLRDITYRKQTEEMLLNEKNKFLTLSESAPFGMVMIDIKGNFTYINPKFRELFGYGMEDIPDGRAWFNKAYPDPEYRKTVISAWVGDLERAKVGQKRPRIFKVSCKDGTEKIVKFIPVLLETGEQIMSCRDITEQKRLEQQLHTMSLTDELTGLYNRRGFITLSGQQLKIAERTKKDMLLFFADLDKMKHINDTLGHQAGDMALVEAAAIFKEVFRESDIIGRMGGDEFAILAIDTTDEAREVLIERLQNTLDNYNKPEGRNYTLSLSIGIAHYDPETPSTLDELMTQADTLMYEEKRNKQH